MPFIKNKSKKKNLEPFFSKKSKKNTQKNIYVMYLIYYI